MEIHLTQYMKAIHNPAVFIKSGKSELPTVIEPGATININHKRESFSANK
jgi:hypothetical protein